MAMIVIIDGTSMMYVCVPWRPVEFFCDWDKTFGRYVRMHDSLYMIPVGNDVFVQMKQIIFEQNYYIKNMTRQTIFHLCLGVRVGRIDD